MHIDYLKTINTMTEWAEASRTVNYFRDIDRGMGIKETRDKCTVCCLWCMRQCVLGETLWVICLFCFVHTQQRHEPERGRMNEFLTCGANIFVDHHGWKVSPVKPKSDSQLPSISHSVKTQITSVF